MPEFILISDGEDDIISMPGPSRPRPRTSIPERKPLTAPIFIDDSDDESPITNIVADVMAERKAKRKSPTPTFSAIAPGRSKLLDLLANDSWRLETPESDGEPEIPLSETKEKKPPAKRKKVETAGDRAEKAAEAARKREEKEQAKQQEKEEKARLKEEAKLAKDIAKSAAAKDRDANKVHVYMTPDLMATSSPIAAALPEIRARLETNLSELHTLKDEECPLASTIRFRRYVTAVHDFALKRWVVVDPPRWEWESTVLIVVKAEDIVDLIMTHNDGLAEWASDARLTLGLSPSDQIVVIIKGLTKYYAKTKSLENREFTAAARAGLGERDVIRRNTAVRPDKAKIEGELVRLQVAERCFLVHVEKTEDIENWVFNLAADVAIRPYKLLDKSHLNFCPPQNATKARDPMQAFEMMLQQMQGMTPGKAHGIAVEYPGFKALMDAYEKAERRGNAELMLADCEVKNNKNGAAVSRRLGKAMSKRVYQIFRGEDGLAFA